MVPLGYKPAPEPANKYCFEDNKKTSLASKLPMKPKFFKHTKINSKSNFVNIKIKNIYK